MLTIDGLHKYYGDIRALDGCSFHVQQGRMLGFLGPNGAGKTTTMRAIFGLLRLDAGEVRWDGRPVTAEDRLRFGYMPEQRGLYPKMKVRDQLVYLGRLHGMAAGDAKGAADRLLAQFGLDDRATDTLDALSHGNQQRIQLAAALIHDPEVLVLDEPFNGLDPMGVETMSAVLAERAAAGATVVFSSHQLDLVEDICQDVAIIHGGKVVLAGEVRALKARSPHRIVEVEVDADGAGLLASIDGIVSASFDGYRHRLIVDAGHDFVSTLARQDSGGIRHFAYTTPSLSDLFREAVA
jgi:ABC-2 type transport system ATP-binding protein